MMQQAPLQRRRRRSLSDGIDAHRDERRTASVDRGVFDVLRRRRQTEDSPPDLMASVEALNELRGKSLEIDAVRAAAVDVAVAAMAIVVRLPPRDLNPDTDDA